MRREIITWSVVAALVLASFAGTVIILNASLYSASGFARGYLDALQRKDVDGALQLAGQRVTGDASLELLVREAMSDLTDIKLVSDDSEPNGLHRVVYSWVADGVAGESTFDVRRTGTLLGLFSTWSFETSPLATLQLTIKHDDRFAANGVELVTPSQNRPAPYLAFAPGTYELTHGSFYLTARPTPVTASSGGSIVAGELDIEANEKFVAATQTAINGALDDCTTQAVLLPTGCPFGQPITNRIVNDPVWSIVEYPTVTVKPGIQSSQWRMLPTAGTAHLVVDVQSLFDGSISTLDEDVPFSVAYTITIGANDAVTVTAQF